MVSKSLRSGHSVAPRDYVHWHTEALPKPLMWEHFDISIQHIWNAEMITMSNIRGHWHLACLFTMSNMVGLWFWTTDMSFYNVKHVWFRGCPSIGS